MALIFTIVIMLVAAYAFFREGLFAALLMLLNVVMAGIVAFNFFEPLANLLDERFQGSALAGYEDALTLTLLFLVALGILRLITNKIADTVLDFAGTTNQIGGAIFGLITGYLVAGFLFCVFQTLPWHESFLDFEPRMREEGGLRSFLPPDRVWLATMRHAGAYPLAWKTAEDKDSPYERYRTFDRQGTFELRYLRYRRYGDSRPPLTYGRELDKSLD